MFQREHLEKCCQQIADRLGWGPISTWSQKEFEQLSDEIFDKTSVRLSITTLKRAFGRLNYDGVPYKTTLDTLAKFNDFGNWYLFSLSAVQENEQATLPRIEDANDQPQDTISSTGQTHEVESVYPEEHHLQKDQLSFLPPDEEEHEILDAVVEAGLELDMLDDGQHTPPSPKKRTNWFTGVIILLSLVAVSGLLSWRQQLLNNGIKPSPKARLSISENYSSTAPHSITMRLEVEASKRQKLILVGYGDTDPNNKPEGLHVVKLNAEGVAILSRTYKHPGMFKIRVFAEHELIANDVVMVGPKGWQARWLDKDSTIIPVVEDGIWRFGERNEFQAGQNIVPDSWTSFNHYTLPTVVSTDSLLIRFRFRSISQGSAPNMFCRLDGTRAPAIIHLTSDVSAPRIYNQIGEVHFEHSSPSRPVSLYATAYEWHTYEVLILKGLATVKVDDKVAYAVEYAEAMGPLVGFSIRSRGKCQLDWLRLGHAPAEGKEQDRWELGQECNTWPGQAEEAVLAD